MNRLTAVDSNGARYTIAGFAADEPITAESPATSALWQSEDAQSWEKVPFEDEEVDAAGRIEGVGVFANGDIAVGGDDVDASTWTVSVD